MASLYRIAPVPAVVKNKTTKHWEELDITTMKLVDLFAKYRPIEVPLLDFSGHEKTLFLHNYEFELRYSTQTLGQWLEAVSNQHLILTDGHPTLEYTHVPYVPLCYYEGTIKTAKSGYHPSHEVAAEDADDLIVSVNEVDPRDMHKHCLFTMNGFFLPSNYQAYGVRVKHAGDIIRKSGTAEGGYLVFNDVGSIQQVPITKEMVYKIDENKTYFDRLIIDTKVNLHNKTVGIVIGGYLHLLDDVVRVTGDTSITLSMRNMNYVERVKQSKDFLDLTFMGMDDLDNGAYMNRIRSDENILKYLTSKYSFLVIIDNPEVRLDKDAVSDTAMAFTYIVPESTPLGLLTDHIGRVIDYWPHWECKQWALKTTHSELPTHLHETTGWFNLMRINDAAIPSKPTEAIRVIMKQITARKK